MFSHVTAQYYPVPQSIYLLVGGGGGAKNIIKITDKSSYQHVLDVI